MTSRDQGPCVVRGSDDHDDAMLTGTVAEAALRQPKTLSPETTVREARLALADDHVHMLLLTAGDRLLGTLLRDDLATADSDDDLALAYAVLDGRTVPSTVNAEVMRRVLVSRGARRRAVVDRDGRLVGLLCLKRRQHGFCSDADVAGRAAGSLVSAAAGSLR